MDFQTFRFIAIAAILYGAFHFAYHKVPDEVLSTKIYPNVIGHFAANTINTLTPDRNVTVKDHSIISKKAKLNIVRGCDGSGVWFMLTAAILGFGASVRHTIIGFVLGTLTVYLINQVRIVGLFYVIEYNRAWFPPVHTYFAPTLIIFLVAGFFLVWTRWSSNDEVATDSKEA
ncbi:MAG: exosortase family protein XrtM [Pseudomonadales bacterium]|nr:exosortase family protein XrtM [Pseudomonadales bacterium]